MYIRNGIYYTDYSDEKGRRHRRSLKTSDIETAKARAREFTAFVKTARLEKEESILWGEFKIWFYAYLDNNKSAGTKYIHELAIKYLEEFKKPVRLRDITPDFLLQFKAFLKEKARKNNNKPGPSGRNRFVRAIKTMMKTAYDFRKIGIKQDFSGVKKEAENDGRVVWHTMDELKQIKVVLEDDLLTTFFLGWEEGLRRGEIVFLYKTDYNPQMHTIAIREKPEWAPKTKKSARVIPLRPDSEKALINSIMRAPPASPYIINIPGDRKNRNYLSYHYRRAIKSKLPHIKSFIHKLRHTYGTILVQNGVHLKVVCDLMGHSNILQTEKYAHTGYSQHVAAVAKIPSISP